jgi:uncharacterized protein (DUF983 family)
MIYKNDRLYYKPDDKDHLLPFCPHCYDAKGLEIHLPKKLVCPQCNTDFHQYSFDEIKRIF